MKRSAKALSFALAVIAFLAMVITIFASSIEVVAMNRSFYSSEYKKLSVAETIGASDETLDNITREMLLYMRGKREDLDMTADISMKGGEAEVFTDLEKEHMVDVVALIRLGFVVRDVSMCVFALALAGAFLVERRCFVKRAAKAYLASAGAFFAFVGGLTLIVSRDFTSAFIKFHELFFTNEKWWLDPAQHVLINLVPEQFFIDTATRIVVIFMVTILALAAIAIFVVTRKQKAVPIVEDDEPRYYPEADDDASCRPKDEEEQAPFDGTQTKENGSEVSPDESPEGKQEKLNVIITSKRRQAGKKNGDWDPLTDELEDGASEEEFDR